MTERGSEPPRLSDGHAGNIAPLIRGNALPDPAAPQAPTG
jgi:hypothetical protein